MVKRIQVSADDITYYTLPGNSAELRNEAGELTDTIYGQAYESSETGLLTWTINSNALYKGFAGYIVNLKKGGVPTLMTAGAMTLVSGKTYQVTDATKRLLDVATVAIVLDNAVDHTSDVLNIDPLFGKVTFKSTYTVTGPVTITTKYVPLTAVAGAKSFTLTQTANPIDTTDIPIAKANGGWRTFNADGLKTINLELGGIYKLSNGFVAALQARALIFIEINPDGSDLTVARGVFKYTGQNQSGDVGALEEEGVTLRLNVPQEDIWLKPFGWNHAAGTKLSMAVQISLSAFENNTVPYIKYLPDGVAGMKGPGVITDISLSGGLEAMNEFTINVQGSDVPTVI